MVDTLQKKLTHVMGTKSIIRRKTNKDVLDEIK